MTTGFKSTDWKNLNFAIVGLGLIGGSFAKALRRLHVRSIIGIDIDDNVLTAAKNQGIIDVPLKVAGEEIRQADVVICALYPEAVIKFVKDSIGFLKEGVLLTDVSGIKKNLPFEVQLLLRPGMEFISGHPMAGRQGSGLDMSDGTIFQGANYIVIPEKHNSEEVIKWLETLAMALGCKHTTRISPEEHDSIIAYTSNLPHIAAVALIDSDSFSEKTKYFIAGSFRDGTRVADINEELWSSLFLANKDRVADEVDKYMEQLQLWSIALRAGDIDSLKDFMRKAATRRKELY
ncbi:MAG: prephenate dehydrogenase/arogenate dehydrogenase family protein [Phascolarctobacterium sp.]|nr:prephenate dehydrogenase/arogenate dehydrogenase family protein [Phascolarctobacterium sp.]MCD8174766.1 prephenate dehydrogenase/arogenate dehydrogenase family protein [Phascolarctobacterium sp.]